MGIFDRLGRVIKANVNSVLDDAEDPEKMVKQTITEMEESIRQGRKEVVQAMASEKVIAKKADKALQKSKDWEEKAMLALKAGDEELAREALRRKKTAEAEAEDLAGQQREAATFVDQLRERIEAAEKKVKELQHGGGMIASRVRKARKQPAAGGSRSNAMDRFDDLAARVDHMEAEVEAASVLDDKPSEAELQRRFARLNVEEVHDDVDDELAALKKQLK